MDIEKNTEDNISEEDIPAGDEEIDAELSRQEQIQYFVLSVLGENCSVQDAINIEKSKKNIKRESFKIINSNIRRVYLYACVKKLWINFLILQAHALKIYTWFYQNISLEYHNDAISKMREARQEFTNLNRLLVTTKKALMRLQLAGTAFCNIDISNLVENIYKKEELLLDRLDDYFKRCELSVKGIRYIGTKENQEQLTETSAIIDDAVKVLGLNQKTLSDKK